MSTKSSAADGQWDYEGYGINQVIQILLRLFIRGRQALTPEGDDADGGGVLTLNHNDENQESLHYARGCYRTLKNYLRDVHTTLEYNAHDHLANIDNPLLLNIQARQGLN